MTDSVPNSTIPALLCAQISTRRAGGAPPPPTPSSSFLVCFRSFLVHFVVSASSVVSSKTRVSALPTFAVAPLACSQQLTIPQMRCVLPVPGGPCTRWTLKSSLLASLNALATCWPAMATLAFKRALDSGGQQLRIACTFQQRVLRFHATVFEPIQSTKLRVRVLATACCSAHRYELGLFCAAPLFAPLCRLNLTAKDAHQTTNTAGSELAVKRLLNNSHRPPALRMG